MIFPKKIWFIGEKVNHIHLNRIENGIYEALSKLESTQTNIKTIANISTVSTFEKNKNYYGTDFTDGYYTGVLSINFSDYDTSFTEKPSVTVTAVTSDPLSVNASVASVSKSGFDIVVRRMKNGNATSVNWKAVGKIV